MLDTFKLLWPNATESQIDSLIWLTPYPFVTKQDVIKKIHEYFQKYGADIQDAIDGETAAFDDECRKFCKVKGLE